MAEVDQLVGAVYFAKPDKLVSIGTNHHILEEERAIARRACEAVLADPNWAKLGELSGDMRSRMKQTMWKAERERQAQQPARQGGYNQSQQRGVFIMTPHPPANSVVIETSDLGVHTCHLEQEEEQNTECAGFDEEIMSTTDPIRS